MKKIAIFLAEGFEEAEAIIPYDTFTRSGFDASLISISDKLEVSSAHKVTIKAHTLFKEVDFDEYDVLFLPGGIPGTYNLNEFQPLLDLINSFNQKGKYVTAICAAPLVLAGQGLLSGKPATIYPGFEDKLGDAITKGNSVEVAGNVITGKGVGVAFEFALKIVELLSSKDEAEKISQQMVLS